MLVGLSFSFCVSDIARGLVDPGEVSKIVSSTRCESVADWDYLIGTYKKVYWHDVADLAEVVARWLLADEMVERPRLTGLPAHNIARGYWLEQSESDVIGEIENVVHDLA